MEDNRVYYRQTSIGGYGYERRIPAVVVRQNASTVRIRLARVNTTTKKMEPVEINVKQNRLSGRSSDCSFESVLAHNTKPTDPQGSGGADGSA